MSGFDPTRATRQLFIDAVIAGLNTRDGSSYGWHLVELIDGDLEFETPQSLQGWDGDKPVSGPHRVLVTVKTLPPSGRRG